MEWRTTYIPPRLDSMQKSAKSHNSQSLWEQLIHSGFMYVHGRDKQFRPLIVINPKALTPFKSYGTDVVGEEIIKWCIFIIEYIKENLFLPGQIENYVVIIDVNKMGITEIPKAALGKVIDWLSKGYRYRTKRMFVLNTTFSLRIGWKVMESFMAEHTKKKMSLSDTNTTKDLELMFDSSQLEEKYGGSASNCTKFWPPWMPSDEYGHDEDDLVSESEYPQIIANNKHLKPCPELLEDDEKRQLEIDDSKSEGNSFHNSRANDQGNEIITMKPEFDERVSIDHSINANSLNK